MRGHTNRYDWAAYYADAYEKQRKKNIVLAGKIADAERRQSDLSDNLNRIYANPFWKVTAPFRKLYHGVKGNTQGDQEMNGDLETSPYLLRYAEEVRRQKQPYLEWVRKENSICYDNAIEINGWQTIRIPDSNIMILTYGKGILDAGVIEKIKSCFDKNPSCKVV